jgi:hypothetical protein
LAKRHTSACSSRLALENDGGLVATLLQVHVEAVVGCVQLAVAEPAEIRGVAVIEDLREGHLPLELGLRKLGPEADVVLAGAPAQALKVGRLDARPRRKGGGRGEGALFLQD